MNWGELVRSYRIFRFIKPYRWYFFFGMVFLVLGSGLFMVFPAAAGEMANAAIGKSKWPFSLASYGLLFLSILVIQGILSYFRTLFFARVSEYGMADLRQELYSKIICQDMAYFESHRIGELTSRLTADVEQLQAAFSVTLAEFIRQIVVLVAGIGIIAWMTPRLALTMLLTFPIIVVASILFGRYVRKLSRERQDALAGANTIVEETLQSFQNVKAFTNELFEIGRYGDSIRDMVRISMRYARTRGVFFIFVITILFGGLFFILWRGAILVERGEMEVGDLFSFILYTGIIGGAIAGIGNLYTAIAGSVGATERIQAILDRPSEVDLSVSATAEIASSAAGQVEFKKVHFNYPSRPDVEVLHDINLQLERGQRVALVGSSGAGKSTIVQLLMRFYEPSAGQLYVDGRPASSYELREYRSRLAIVPQEILLFGGSIRDNIKYGKPHASENEVRDAAQKSNSLEFIESFPQGFDTIVGERGMKLSGGQRQRIAIARAILKDPSILILDEATSSLDAESERLVQDALDKLMSNRTSLIIAHRLSTIREADCIYVLQRGRIVERGTHEELVSIEYGVYRRLVELQLDPVE